MNERSVSRWTGLAGIATVICALVAFAIFGALSPPNETDSASDIASFFADNRTVLAVLVYLVALSFAFNLIFFVGLRDVLRRRAADTEMLATVGAAGGALFIAIAYVGFGVLLQLVYREGAGNQDTQKTLFDVYTLNITMASVPTAVAAIAFSIAILQSRVLPAWLAWYGFVMAAAHLIGMGALARDGFFAPGVIGGYVAPLMFYAWVLAYSVLLLRHPRKSP
jgi:magnesium-transporting ATPase (P-type)